MFFKKEKKISQQAIANLDEQQIESLQVYVMPQAYPIKEEVSQKSAHVSKKWIIIFGGGSILILAALLVFFFLFKETKKAPSVQAPSEKSALVTQKSGEGEKGVEKPNPSQSTETKDNEEAPSSAPKDQAGEEEGPKEPQTEAPLQTEQPFPDEGAQDADKDGLSDHEENLYRTHIRRADSDGDGYTDGEEVLHLYDPNAALQRLSESSAIAQYVHPEIQYRVLYPSKLEIQTLREGKTFFYDTVTGDAIFLDWKALAPGESFESWVAKESIDESKAAVQPLTIDNESYTVFETTDQSIRYVVLPAAVLVFSYVPGNAGAWHLKTTFDMMLMSFHSE